MNIDEEVILNQNVNNNGNNYNGGNNNHNNNDNVNADQNGQQGGGRRGGIGIDVQQQGNPQQRLRIVNAPVDNTLLLNFAFSHMCQEISLAELEREDAISLGLNYKYIDLQLLRIITSSQTAGANIYNRRVAGPRNNINSNQTRFSRLFLFRQFSPNNPHDSSKLVYMMEARNENVNM